MACVIAGSAALPELSDACTRAVYLGPDDMIVTGRTMDWKEDPQSNIYFFPRGMARRGAETDNTVRWTSAYGSVVTAGYDIGVCDGMNEKGLVANLLFLAESDYHRSDDNRPVMGLSIWTQYNAGNKVMKLTLTNGGIYSGDAAGEMRDSKPLMFLFGV